MDAQSDKPILANDLCMHLSEPALAVSPIHPGAPMDSSALSHSGRRDAKLAHLQGGSGSMASPALCIVRILPPVSITHLTANPFYWGF